MKYVTGRPNLLDTKSLSKKLEQVLGSGILTNNGPKVIELEEEFESLTGVPCVAVANATLGLEALCRIFKISDVPSFSFVASVSALRQSKDLNVFYDVDDYYQPSLQSIRKKGTILTSLFGSCGNIDEYSKICTTSIYDNAHGLGVKWNGRYLANYGNASVYSLHATKFINGVEGGLVSCSDLDIIDTLKEYRNFGFMIQSSDIFSGEVSSLGTNAKMSELHATVALHNLHYLDFLIDLNRERYEWYLKWLPAQCELIKYSDIRISPNYSYIIVRVNESVRDKLCEYLYKEGVYVKKYFTPVHKMKTYSNGQTLPNTEKISKEVIALPQGVQLRREEDVLWICTKIREFFKTVMT